MCSLSRILPISIIQSQRSILSSNTNYVHLVGYTPIMDDKSKGALSYVHDSINVSACDELNNSKFEASVWRTVQLNNRDSLLVGVVY